MWSKSRSSSGTGTFYSTIAPGAVITSAVTDATGHVSFLYEDGTVGTPTLTATDATGASGSQTEKVIAADAITFLTSPTSTPAGQRSTPITIQVADEGAPVANEVVFLSSTTAAGFHNFYDGVTGAPLPTTAGGVPFVVTNASGQASFLYEDVVAGGAPTLKATEAANAAVFGQQRETVTNGVASSVAFTNGATTANAGQVSGPYTIQVNTLAGNPVVGDVVNLSTDSGGGVFYNGNGAGAVVITSVITNASGQASFFYEDTTVGTPTLTATDAGDGASGSQKETVNAGAVTAITTVVGSATTESAGRQSGTITILVKAGAAAVPDEVVNLTTTSATGVFYNSAGTAVITQVITNATGNASFLYEDTTPGTPTLTFTDAGDGVFGTLSETVTAGAVTAVNFTSPPSP